MRKCILILSVLLLAGALPPIGSGAVTPPAPDWHTKVDRWVLDTASMGDTEFLVFLADQADLHVARGLRTKPEKGELVHRILSQHAERTQGPIRAALRRLGMEWRPYWIVNAIWVKGDIAAIQALAERTDVAHLYANPRVKLDLPPTETAAPATEVEPEIEWNILRVNANDVWAQGVFGEGVVIGGADTGYDWEHPALKDKYRGWHGVTASHDYNWYDPTGDDSGTCANTTEPCDDYGHGTHTMGIMVGDGRPGYRIGMAPEAQWIGCRNMVGGWGTPQLYMACYEWFVAPTRMDGSDSDTAMAPDVINNSWGCPADEDCDPPDILLPAVQNVRAAGIVTVHSAGNEGASCSTVSTPAGIYEESFTVGATTNTEDDLIYYRSSRGPVTVDDSNRMKPNVAAPGVGIRSCVPGDGYASMSGTSMAAPHVAGAIALLISANPALRGQVDTLENLLEATAVRRDGLLTDPYCGTDTAESWPNNVYGWGRIDAYAAYLQAVAPCVPPAGVSSYSITRTGASQQTVDWDAVEGAGKYRVAWDTSPYFTFPATCASPSCLEMATTTLTGPASEGPGLNYTYAIEPVAACGAVPATPARVSLFEYELAPGD